MFRLFLWLDQFTLFGIDIASYNNGLTNNGNVNEEISNRQKPILVRFSERRSHVLTNNSINKSKKKRDGMGERVFLSVVVAGLLILGIAGACPAGIEPSPFEPEINKLHSIEQSVAAINKRLTKLNEFETLPEGVTEYLNAMANQMQGLKGRLEEVLLVVPLPSYDAPYIGQDEVVFVLDSIRIDSKEAFDIVEDIVSRMGVEPSPFLPLFNDVSRRIIIGINDHLRTAVIPPVPPPPPITFP
jgi:hypothetical protein